MDAEIILVTIYTKISIKQPELADKYQNLYETTRISWEIAISLKGTQNGQFWPKCKGGTLCKNLKIGYFFGPNLKGYKILNTGRILASLVWMDAQFIVGSVDTKISLKQHELAEK